jgi:pimeloyl-ACP methyl ester carboxylesterase
MSTFVLVHGGFHGGWCWKYVTPLLRAAGHEVFTPTLTGLGERSHLARPDTGLETHIQDIIGVLTYEDLHEVILVGHSLGGPVVLGVADRVPERIAHLVYLDASVPRDGEADVDCYPPEKRVRAWIESLLTPNNYVWTPILKEHPFDITNEQQAQWVNSKLTPHPLKAFLDPVHLTNPDPHANARTFILCTMADPTMTSVTRVRSEPGWQLRELNTGHDAMVTAPKELVQILVTLV